MTMETLVVVHDDPAWVDRLRSELAGSLGIVHATSGDEAMASLQAGKRGASVALVDPLSGDAFRLCNHVRCSRELRGIPVVLLVPEPARAAVEQYQRRPRFADATLSVTAEPRVVAEVLRDLLRQGEERVARMERERRRRSLRRFWDAAGTVAIMSGLLLYVLGGLFSIPTWGYAPDIMAWSGAVILLAERVTYLRKGERLSRWSIADMSILVTILLLVSLRLLRVKGMP